MSDSIPLFSVIIPTHNRSILLERALLSVKAQSVNIAIEVIVVSDSCDLETDLICNKYLEKSDIFIRRNGTSGPAHSRNLGLKISSGQYILFLDDDDAWHPGFLDLLSDAVIINPNQILYFNCSVVKESRFGGVPNFISESFLNLETSLNNYVYVKNQVHMSCFVFPKFLIKDILFDHYLRAYEDWDFQLAVFQRNFPIYIPIMGSKVFEVDDSSTDRRGSSEKATDLNAVFDYLYIYRRRPSPNDLIKNGRRELLLSVGIEIDVEML